MGGKRKRKLLHNLYPEHSSKFHTAHKLCLCSKQTGLFLPSCIQEGKECFALCFHLFVSHQLSVGIIASKSHSSPVLENLCVGESYTHTGPKPEPCPFLQVCAGMSRTTPSESTTWNWRCGGTSEGLAFIVFVFFFAPPGSFKHRQVQGLWLLTYNALVFIVLRNLYHWIQVLIVKQG